MFNADCTSYFEIQWKELLKKLEINSRYDSLTALKNAIRMAAGLNNFWFSNIAGQSICILEIAGNKYKLAVRFGDSYGKSAVRIESIAEIDGTEPDNIISIPLKI